MSDEGFKQTDLILDDLERQLTAEYQQAADEITEKANAYFARFQKEDAVMREKLNNKLITKAQYGEWRTRRMMQGSYWTAMKNALADDLVNTDKLAMQYVTDAYKDVYALNMNYGTYLIENDSEIDTAFTLYNRDAVERLIKENPDLLPPPVDIAKDMRWNKQKIQSAVLQGILQGESIPKIADRLSRVANMDKNAAVRNARTAVTSARMAEDSILWREQKNGA